MGNALTAESDQILGYGSRETTGGFLARCGAICGYLAAGLSGFLVPLAVYLLAAPGALPAARQAASRAARRAARRDSAFLRVHLAQAVNAAITTALYALCSAIAGGLLTLDSVYLGLRVAITGAMFAWLVTFGYLIGAALAAARGRFYRIPGCLCATLLKPGA